MKSIHYVRTKAKRLVKPLGVVAIVLHFVYFSAVTLEHGIETLYGGSAATLAIITVFGAVIGGAE